MPVCAMVEVANIYIIHYIHNCKVTFHFSLLSLFSDQRKLDNYIMHAEWKSMYDICNKSTNLSNILISHRRQDVYLDSNFLSHHPLIETVFRENDLRGNLAMAIRRVCFKTDLPALDSVELRWYLEILLARVIHAHTNKQNISHKCTRTLTQLRKR